MVNAPNFLILNPNYFTMSEYKPQEIEKKWQKTWKENHTFKTEFPSAKPKYYVLDMFPYPSGAGLHVGHPLGYIATDIVARYKRLKGFNVLHPMGYDSFGLPAEQYAVQTGQHPAITTENNINRYHEQLDNIGFSYDWSCEVRTSNPDYYKWTQWIFLQLFNHYYDKKTNKAELIEKLFAIFEKEGNISSASDKAKVGNGSKSHNSHLTSKNFVCDEDTPVFSAQEWNGYSNAEKHKISLKYRLTYLSNTFVNWCPKLGTVLANEEVKDGLSERGSYPVVRKEMAQWSMRITAYAERLIQDLDTIDWPDSIKEQQKYWIGKSKGCMLTFKVLPSKDDLGGETSAIDVFTTRVDTIYGVTYLTLAPEHELIEKITTPAQKTVVEKYVQYAKNKSELDRQADVKTVTGEFTGAFAINPLNNQRIPIYIGEYVLAGYGTGAVMAVPSSDTRDFAFATYFNLPIIQVQEGAKTDITKEDFDPKAGTMINSDFLNGMNVKAALDAMTKRVEEIGVGYGKINYKIRDSIFSRQRYWGEPIPIYYKDGLPYGLEENQLPLELPQIDEYKPTENGEPPLARAKNWVANIPFPNGEGSYTSANSGSFPLETNTMPGWAGSSWYFLRYMDPQNTKEFASKAALDYWESVDLYLGGSEHATGHLLYSRFWHKFLFDMGLVKTNEYAKKLINQGMIQGVSGYVKVVHSVTTTQTGSDQRIKNDNIYIISNDLEHDSIYHQIVSDIKNQNPNVDFEEYKIEFNYIIKEWEYVDIMVIDTDDSFDINIFLKNKFKDMPDFNFDELKILKNKNDKFIAKRVVEKMSKSKLNVVNPDDVIEKYGADTLRLYEMFLGPLELSKPWSTSSISGTSRFLRNVWKLFFDENGKLIVTDETPNDKELKTLHKTIKKVEEDIERFSFNTSVSTFMVCVNELSDLKCHKKAILSQFLIVLAPYAPHIAEELWEALGNKDGISYQSFPICNEKYLIESSFEYPISINGKVRHKMNFPANADMQEVENQALASAEIQKWLEGKAPKKVIVVPNKIVNIVQ